MWCVADVDEDYIARMEDVLETYEQPTVPNARWCVWMRSPSRCTPASAAPRRPCRGGGRGATATASAAELKAGRHCTVPTPDRPAFQFAQVGGEIRDRFDVHRTPTHGSWPNQAGIEICLFARQCLGARRIPDLKTLRREARSWNRRMSRDHVKINWKFDRKAARRRFGYKTTPFTRP